MTRNCELRISDFGLARERPKELEGSADKTDEEGMTEVRVPHGHKCAVCGLYRGICRGATVHHKRDVSRI